MPKDNPVGELDFEKRMLLFIIKALHEKSLAPGAEMTEVTFQRAKIAARQYLLVNEPPAKSPWRHPDRIDRLFQQIRAPEDLASFIDDYYDIS